MSVKKNSWFYNRKNESELTFIDSSFKPFSPSDQLSDAQET